MSYNFDAVPSRRNATILNKWTYYPQDVLPLWLADMDFPTAPIIAEALQRQMQHGVLGYELPSRSLREIIARRMKKLYGWEVDPDSVLYIAGVNNGYNIAVRVFCSSKKGYLIQTPVYNEFHDTAQKTGFRQRTAQLEKKVDGTQIHYEIDFDGFKKEIPKAGMFLLCHPHNPVGKVYSPAELRRMAEICLEHDVAIVSDEIHSELLLGGSKFTPLASLSADIEARTITLISAAKTFNLSGLSCAFAIIPDEKLRQKFYAMGESMSIEISTPGLTAARIAFAGKADSWLNSLRRYLTGNRNFVLEYLETYLPEVRVTKPDATYLMWLDCSALKLEPSPYHFFLNQAKVAFSDGANFDRDCGQFIRLNFGTTRQILARALDRVKKSLR